MARGLTAAYRLRWPAKPLGKQEARVGLCSQASWPGCIYDLGSYQSLNPRYLFLLHTGHRYAHPYPLGPYSSSGLERHRDTIDVPTLELSASPGTLYHPQYPLASTTHISLSAQTTILSLLTAVTTLRLSAITCSCLQRRHQRLSFPIVTQNFHVSGLRQIHTCPPRL